MPCTITSFTDAQITAVNDQHAFLQIPPDSDLRVGAVVRLGLVGPLPYSDGEVTFRFPLGVARGIAGIVGVSTGSPR